LATESLPLSYENNNNGKLEQSIFDVKILDIETLQKQKKTIKHLIVATKSHDLLLAIKGIIHLLAKDASIVTLCNGYGFQNELEDLLSQRPDTRWFMAITSDGAILKHDNKLSHTGFGHTYIGTWFADQVSPQPDLSFLGKPNAFLSFSVCNDIQHRCIQKFFVNCAINSLTTIYQCLNGQLIDNLEINDKFTRLCHELQGIYSAVQQKQSHSALTSFNVHSAASEIAQKTAQNVSSMLRDRQQGKQLELNYLNRQLISLARELKVDAPLSDAIMVDLEKISNATIDQYE
jgi:2-dehydropantoate 2-reductase